MLLNDSILVVITLLLMAAFILAAVYLYAPFKIRHQQVKDMNVDYRPIELPNRRDPLLPSTPC